MRLALTYSVVIIIIFGHTVFCVEMTLEQQAVLGLLTPNAVENPGVNLQLAFCFCAFGVPIFNQHAPLAQHYTMYLLKKIHIQVDE